jgi:II/X family phage/plasmid replication protein
MIDWVTMKIACDHVGIISNGSVVKVSKDNEIEWTALSWLPVAGSYDSNIVIRSVSDSQLEISGNPAKWLQGHNLFGTNDLIALCWAFFSKLCTIKELCLTPSVEQIRAIKEGIFTVSRIDGNETWLLANRFEVLSWIRSAEQKVRLKHRGTGQFKGSTLYWGKGSKRWFLKCYSKGEEINSKNSNFPDALRTPQMLEYAERALRVEMTIKSNALREMGLHIAANWTPETAKMLLLNSLKGLEMSNNFSLSNDVLVTLPPRVRLAYAAWYNGDDLRQILSRPTFYRYRKQLKEYDIDISILRDVDKEPSNVIPLIRVLEAQPVGIPDWAFEQGLVVCA